MSPKGRHTLRYADGRTAPLQLAGKALNRGADGAIYRSPDGRYAIKYYHEPGKDPTRQQKVWQMILHPPEDTSAQHFAWPQALLLNQRNEFAGFAMPLLDVASHVSLDMVLSTRGRQMQKLPQAVAWRLEVAINLAKRVAELHAQGHCIIDLKPANLLVHRRSGDVAVVDCDGFAVRGNSEYFPAHQFTAGFIAPEAFRAKQSPQVLRQPQDAFALAVILFKLINGGLHPYQGVPDSQREVPSDNQNRIAGGFYPYGLQPHRDLKPSPWSIHRDFPRILREHFDRSFTRSRRPSAQDWVGLLEQAKARLKTCSQDSDHSYWGPQCLHCERAKTQIKVVKPQRRQPPPRTVPNPPRRTAAPAVRTRPVSTRAGSSGLGRGIFTVMFAIVMLGAIMGDGCSLSRNKTPPYQPAPVQVQQRPAIDQETLAWRMRTPALEAQYTVYRTAIYAEHTSTTSSASGTTLEAIPFYRFGAFDKPESLNLLMHQPSNSNYLGLVMGGFDLARLDMQTGAVNSITQYERRAAYSMEFWQVDPRPGRQGAYLPQCSPRGCTTLQRLTPGQEPINYNLPEWKHHSPFDGYPYWRYRLSPEGNFIVIASASQVAVFDVDEPQQPIALLNLPEAYADFRLGSLSVGSRAETLILGLSKQERFGVNFQSAIVELSRKGSELSLDDSFAEHARAAGSELLGAYQTLSRDGTTLAVSEYQQVENNNTVYARRYGSQATIAVGHPAISIWERDGRRWRLRQRIEWQGLRNSQKLQISSPRQMSVMGGQLFRFGNPKILSVGQPHQELQLSPDGTRLLSGLEVDSRGFVASSYLFDIRGKKPSMLGRMTTEGGLPRVGLKSAYPSVRMSESGEHAVMGWFLHADDPDRSDQSLKAEVFAFPELQPIEVVPFEELEAPPLPLPLEREDLVNPQLK